MRLRLLAAAAAVALVPSLMAAGPARADTQSPESSTIYQGYARTVTTRFYSPNICVRTSFAGVISFRRNVRTWHRSTEGDTLDLYWIDRMKLTNNTMTIHTYKPNGSTCTSTPKRYVTLRAKLKAGAYACSMHPSFSVSAPWGVGFSFWPSCGRTELAGWSEFDADGGTHFKLSHSNDRVGGYGSQEKNWSPTKRTNLTWACAGLAADVTPKTGSAVDTKTTKKIKACPVWNGSTAGF